MVLISVQQKWLFLSNSIGMNEKYTIPVKR